MRTTLDRAEQIEALISAARELDRERGSTVRAIPRAALLSTLFSRRPDRRGACVALVRRRPGRRADADPRLEDDAGVRQLDLLPVLREELSVLKASTPYPAQTDFVFPTETGGLRTPLTSATASWRYPRASQPAAHRARSGPLPEGLTPHSMRRTFISLVLAIGEDVPYVMGQVGHADPKVTLSIYAQVMFRGEGERERLKGW